MNARLVISASLSPDPVDLTAGRQYAGLSDRGAREVRFTTFRGRGRIWEMDAFAVFVGQRVPDSSIPLIAGAYE
jgi:hypothetical protein